MILNTMIHYQDKDKELESLNHRTSLLTEVVSSLQSIKLFAYESLFHRRIAELRQTETGWARKIANLRAAATVIGTCLPAVAAVCTFAVYVALGNQLDLGRTFSTLQFFNFIQQPLMWFPQLFSTLSYIITASGMCTIPFAFRCGSG
jgi:ABC-type multidrug transport system fused ATPase/permease subunit